MPPAKRERWTLVFAGIYLILPEYHEESTVLYIPVNSIEVDTFSIVKEPMADGKLVYSKMYRVRLKWNSHYIRSLDDLKRGTFGVLEPKHKQCKLVTDLSHGFVLYRDYALMQRDTKFGLR